MRFLQLIWSNLTRKKIRTAFTFLSIVVAFLLFAFLMAIKNGFDAGIDIAGQNRLLTIHKVSLIQLLPIRYLNDIKKTEGVRNASHFSWFGGVYVDKKGFFPQMACDPESMLEIYPEYIIPDEQKQAFIATRTGALAGRLLAERFGWEIGDRIPIQATIWRPNDGGSNVYEFDLVAIYDGARKDVDESGFYFQYDYLKERVGDIGQIGWYVVEVENPETADQVALAIDAKFANSSAETKTTTEKAFMRSFAKQIGDTGSAIMLIAGVVFFVCLLISGNTIAQSVRERTNEIGVLKTLGFPDRTVLLLVMSESVVLCGLAGCVGLGLAALLVPGMAPAMQAVLPVFFIPTEGFIAGVALALGLGIASGVLPAITAMRLPIVTALRRT